MDEWRLLQIMIPICIMGVGSLYPTRVISPFFVMNKFLESIKWPLGKTNFSGFAILLACIIFLFLFYFGMCFIIECQGKLGRKEMASICAKSEHYIGTEGGGMDQAIAFMATAGMGSTNTHTIPTASLSSKLTRADPLCCFLVDHNNIIIMVFPPTLSCTFI